MNIKRLTAFLLGAVLLIPALYACGDAGSAAPSAEETNGASAEETPAEETDADLTDGLPDVDLNGRVIRLLSHHDRLSDESTIYAYELTGETVNDAIYMRDSNLKTRFNYDTEVHHGEAWTDDQTMLRNSILAGTRDYDMAFFLPFGGNGTVITEGLCKNMLDVAYLDFSRPWWHTAINDSYTFSGYLPCVSSDYLLSSYQYANILIFNKGLAESYHTDNIYQLVRDGQWTLDKFREIIEPFSFDADGNGVYDDKDSYGYATNYGYHASPGVTPSATAPAPSPKTAWSSAGATSGSTIWPSGCTTSSTADSTSPSRSAGTCRATSTGTKTACSSRPAGSPTSSASASARANTASSPTPNTTKRRTATTPTWTPVPAR